MASESVLCFAFARESMVVLMNRHNSEATRCVSQGKAGMKGQHTSCVAPTGLALGELPTPGLGNPGRDTPALRAYLAQLQNDRCEKSHLPRVPAPRLGAVATMGR